MAKAAHERIDAFFILHAGRADSWRDVTNIASHWKAGTSKREELKTALADLAVLEEFHAVPGPRIMRLLQERIEETRARSELSAPSRATSAASSSPTSTWSTMPAVNSNPRPRLALASASGAPIRWASSPACW